MAPCSLIPKGHPRALQDQSTDARRLDIANPITCSFVQTRGTFKLLTKIVLLIPLLYPTILHSELEAL